MDGELLQTIGKRGTELEGVGIPAGDYKVLEIATARETDQLVLVHPCMEWITLASVEDEVLGQVEEVCKPSVFQEMPAGSTTCLWAGTGPVLSPEMSESRNRMKEMGMLRRSWPTDGRTCQLWSRSWAGSA